MRWDESSGSRHGGSIGSPVADDLFVEWYGSGVVVSDRHDQPDELWRLVSTVAEPANGVVVMVSSVARRWSGIALVLSQARRRATEELSGTEWSPSGRPVRLVSAHPPDLDFPLALCRGWGRIGPRLYRQPLGDRAAIAEVLPAGILLRPSGMYASGASAFFDPLAGRLAVGTTGVAVAEALVVILVALFAEVRDAGGWMPRMCIDGFADERLVNQLDVLTDPDAVAVPGAEPEPAAVSSAPEVESSLEVTEAAGSSAPQASVTPQVQTAGNPVTERPAPPVEAAPVEAAPVEAAPVEAAAPASVGTSAPHAPARQTTAPPVVTVTAPVLEGPPGAPPTRQPTSSGPGSGLPAPASPEAAARFVVAGGPATQPPERGTDDPATQPAEPGTDDPAAQPPEPGGAPTRAVPSAAAVPASGRPFPAEPPLRVDDRASTAVEQRRFVAALGDDFTRSLATVNAALAAWPALRRDDSPGTKVDYVAVCVYLGQDQGGAVRLNAALRRGDPPEIDGYLPCLVSGLQRLPLQRRAVLCQGRLDTPVPESYPVGMLLTEPGFRSASVSLAPTVPGATVDFLIWGRTARQASVLTLGRPLEEAIFLPGTRFKVLALHHATDEEEPGQDGEARLPRWTVLLREVLPGEVRTPDVQKELDASVLARLARALEQRRSRTPQVVKDADLSERLAGSLVGLSTVAG